MNKNFLQFIDKKNITKKNQNFTNSFFQQDILLIITQNIY